MHRQLLIMSEAISLVSPLKLLLVHVTCGIGLVFSFWIVHNLHSLTLIEDSARALRTIWAIECPVVILVYSLFRRNPNQCSYIRAIARGLLSLPVGALANAFGAIVLGAPVGIQQFPKTLHWSLLMSVLTFVPAASVYGLSWTDWSRVFAQSKPNGAIDFMICIPAHGAVIGAWLGAWPMPLDWERPWQEWPICVTYGAVVGYVVGMVVSCVLVMVSRNREKHHQKKSE